VRIDTFAYDLPEELVAQKPAAQREEARLLHLPHGGDAEEHLRVADLPDLIPEGTLVVVNDTRVIPARLLGTKASGGRAEVFLLERASLSDVPIDGTVQTLEVWRALGRSNRPLREGTVIAICARDADRSAPSLYAHVIGRRGDGLLEVGLRSPFGPVDVAIRACGRVPLPPYIRREDASDDALRYQTIYARRDGAVAAPSAGLHLTEALLDRLRRRGCEVATVTLHVGLGTFQPVEVDDLDLHPMHAERYVVPAETVDAVARARARGARVLAVGTTTVRALESAADPARQGHARALDGETRLLIQPGYPWGVVDALLTNFHLPRSTLLALVCAFAGTERVLGAYGAAVRERYRFFSYGDAMLLWRKA
jgi:S-adenosylmethionine:tRNA ribosyltransferase-isomerase